MRHYIHAIISAITLLSACQKMDNPYDFPLLDTHEVKDISNTGALFSADFLKADDFEVIEYGFVWAESMEPTKEDSYVKILGEPADNQFNIFVDFDLTKNKNYRVRSYAKTFKNTVYGPSTDFLSLGCLPPQISGFAPETCDIGDQFTISGIRFSNVVLNNTVTIGNKVCKVVEASDTLLKVVAPNLATPGPQVLKVTVAEQSDEADTQILVTGGYTTGISSVSGIVGSEVFVDGFGFDTNDEPYITFVDEFDNYLASAYAEVLSDTRLRFWVPDLPPGADYGMFLITYIEGNWMQWKFPQKFLIKNAWQKIGDTSPMTMFTSTATETRYTSVLIGNSVFVLGGSSIYEYNTIANSWHERAAFPGGYRFRGAAFVLDGIIYYTMGTGYHVSDMPSFNGMNYKDLWKYDPTMDKWEYVMETPMNDSYSPTAVVLNNMVYILCGDQFWIYNPSTGAWTNTYSPVSSFRYYDLGFTSSGKCYFLMDFSLDEYNPDSGLWSSISNNSWDLAGNTAALHNGNPLVFSYWTFTEYDFTSNFWFKRQTVPSQSEVFQFAHMVDNKLFYCAGSLWVMDLNQ